MKIADRIDELVRVHGSLRAVARVTEIDAGYLSRLRAGEKDNPEPGVLRSLGLRRVVDYELLPSATRRREPTHCGYCSYEEADGSLIAQCQKCEAADAPGTAAPKEPSHG